MENLLDQVTESVKMTEYATGNIGYLILACVCFYLSLLLLITAKSQDITLAVYRLRIRKQEIIHNIKIHTARKIKRTITKAEMRKEIKNERENEEDDD